MMRLNNMHYCSLADWSLWLVLLVILATVLSYIKLVFYRVGRTNETLGKDSLALNSFMPENSLSQT